MTSGEWNVQYSFHLFFLIMTQWRRGAACIFVSVTFYNCLDLGHLRLLLISQSGARSGGHWPMRGGRFLLRGASNFLPSTDKTRCEKKQRCSLIYIHLPENTFIKEPHFGKRSVLLGCYPQTRHEVPLIFENIQKTFHQGFRQTSLLTVFLVKFLIWETFEVGFCFYCSL